MSALVQPPDPDALDWQAQGLCRRIETVGPEDFFYEGRYRNQRSKSCVEHIARLRTICKACPVRQICDEEADRKNEAGFWAGLTADERKRRRRADKAASA